MGIRDLDKLLSCVNCVFTLQSTKELGTKPTSSGELSHYDKCCEEIGFPVFRDFRCHIDFSILLHKIFYTSSTMDEAVQKFSRFFASISKNNNVYYIYTDPIVNKRKTLLKQSRKKAKCTLIDKTKQSIKENLQCSPDIIQSVKKEILNDFNIKKSLVPHIIINSELAEILCLYNDTTQHDITYEEYKRHLYILNNKPLVLEQKPESNETLYNTTMHDNFLLSLEALSDEEEVDEEVVQQLLKEGNNNFLEASGISSIFPSTSLFTSSDDNIEFKEDINGELTLDYDTSDATKFKQIIEETNKKNFMLFINVNSFAHHKRYILEQLIQKKIISPESIIESDCADAEICIIKEIKKNDWLGTRNMIFSSDQDILLFSLLYLTSPSVCFKKDITAHSDNVHILQNINISANLAKLIFVFNKSDYFYGIKQYCLTNNRLQKLYKSKRKILIDSTLLTINQVLNLHYDNLLILLGRFLMFETFNKKLRLSESITMDCISRTIANMYMYFDMSDEFYKEAYEPKHIDITSLRYFLYKQGYYDPDAIRDE